MEIDPGSMSMAHSARGSGAVRVLAPTSTDEASSILAERGQANLAGVSLEPAMNFRLESLETLVDINRSGGSRSDRWPRGGARTDALTDIVALIDRRPRGRSVR